MWDNHWWVGVAPQGLKGGEGAFVYRGLAPPAKIWRPRCGLEKETFFCQYEKCSYLCSGMREVESLSFY